MDYIFVNCILGSLMLLLVASYDIACQFFKNFSARVAGLPSSMQVNPLHLLARIPKAHIGYHGPKCQSAFSFNFTRGMGRTEGEGIERSWGWLNKAAPSVKEMGPSGRRETVDDFCGYANWRKTIRLGATFHHLSAM